VGRVGRTSGFEKVVGGDFRLLQEQSGSYDSKISRDCSS
jgi:hypothetical protein